MQNVIKILTIMTLLFSSVVYSEVRLGTEDTWGVGVNGHIPVFMIVSDNDGVDERAFRITTGFNPATLQTNIYAPTQDGVDVSGHFQLNSHYAGADGVQNSGFGKVGSGRQSGVESRVAMINITNDTGTLSIGKGFGIFGVPAIGDIGSAKGVGLFSPNGGDATAGRIGNGYFYTNFNPRVTYSMSTSDNLSFSVGVFQPEKPKDGTAIDDSVATELPRFEGNLVWAQENMSVWTSGFYQSVKVNDDSVNDFDMYGIDFGGSISLDALTLRANYAVTQGTGNFVVGGHGVVGGSQEESANQWYVEGTYGLSSVVTVGASYGQGSDDLSNNNTDLTMLFARYEVTNNLTIIGELQNHTNDTNSDYKAGVVGAQFTF